MAENRRTVDYVERVAMLDDIISQAAHSDTPYDCIVAWSGGKDSSAIALHVRDRFGLRPLLVTFSPLIPTREGEINRTRLLDLGFDSVTIRPNQRVSRQLARRFLIERGDPKVHWNAGINAGPVQIAVRMKIPIVFYAEHGESEYGGRLLSPQHLFERDLEEVLEHQIGDDPLNWLQEDVKENDLFPYQYPASEEVESLGLRALYFGYFHPWDVTENYKFVSENFPFQGNFRGRTYGTFTDYDSVDDVMDDLYYYMQFIKFGFGRCLRDAARMIQRGKLSRMEAFDLIDAYDGEFPESSIDECLDYVELTRKDFNRVVDQHRSSWIWRQSAEGEWQLRVPPTL